MTSPRFPDLISRLPATVPFVGPEVQERQRGMRFAARLGANESMFGPSPFAIAAMQDEAAEAWKYADPSSFDLKNALADRMGCTPDNIVLGEGIDGLLGNCVRLLVQEGDAVVTSDGAYPTFNYHVNGFGGVLHTVDYRDDHEDLDALAAKAREVGARLVYLSNPDNPMGTRHTAEAVADFRRSLPESTLLVLDEAYTEFAPEGTNPPIDPSDAGVIRLRTFSKIYGLAGLRVGYAIAHPDAVTGLNKIRNHFGVNRVAQQAALAALQDQAYIEGLKREIETGKRAYAGIAERHGFTAIPSHTNFVAFDVGGAERGERLLKALQDRRVFIRKPGVPPLDRCIRVTVGPEAERAIFEQAFAEAVAEVG